MRPSCGFVLAPYSDNYGALDELRSQLSTVLKEVLSGLSPSFTSSSSASSSSAGAAAGASARNDPRDKIVLIIVEHALPYPLLCPCVNELPSPHGHQIARGCHQRRARCPPACAVGLIVSLCPCLPLCALRHFSLGCLLGFDLFLFFRVDSSPFVVCFLFALLLFLPLCLIRIS